ncbi:MAG: Crp/Fnr family transcriptional regulator [Clostridia bacterium]|nr:Crp/Fnr family transcriptional regulator [Clostridia bacterium]
MKKYIPILKETQLFSGISENEIEPMLSCLQAEVRSYKKGEYVLSQGDSLSYITVLLEGCLHVQKDDYWGNRSIVNVVGEGDMFGEAYAIADDARLLNDVLAVEDCRVIFFDVKRVITVCSSACRFHSMVVQNLFFAISEKNRRLVQKIGHMSKRTTREKLISYLSEEASKQQSSTFLIPFNRQQLADFLCVDRSAMSNELCKMRNEGLIKFERKQFTLL